MSDFYLCKSSNKILSLTNKKSRITGLAIFLVIVVVFLIMYGGWLIGFLLGENVTAVQIYVLWLVMSGLTVIFVLILRKLNRDVYIAALVPAIFIFWLPVVFLQRMYLPFGFPGLDFLLPLLLFIVITQKTVMHTHISWFNVGKIDRLSLIFIIVLCIISGSVLWLWSMLRPDVVEHFRLMLPDVGWIALIVAGIAFAFTNAFVEEALFRGAIRDGLLQLVAPRIEVLTTSLLFALLHINGFPSGILGVTMVFLWGILLGVIRNRTAGLLGPFVAHVAADLTIFSILAIRLF